MTSVTSGVSRATNDRKRSMSAGMTASSLNTGMTILSSGPPIQKIQNASSVTESGHKSLCISEQALGATLNPFLIDCLVYPEVHNSPCKVVRIGTLVRRLEEIIHWPV